MLCLSYLGRAEGVEELKEMLNLPVSKESAEPSREKTSGRKAGVCVWFVRSESRCAQRIVIWRMAVPALDSGGGTGLGSCPPMA